MRNSSFTWKVKVKPMQTISQNIDMICDLYVRYEKLFIEQKQLCERSDKSAERG